MGAGSVFGAVFVLPRAREMFSSNASTILANLLVAVVYLLMAFVRQPSIFMIVAALAGTGWTLGAAELWVASQRAIPGWARGRMSATVIMVSQGAIALGGVVWGFSSQAAGVSITLVIAAVTLTLSLLLAIPLLRRIAHLIVEPRTYCRPREAKAVAERFEQGISCA
jgi:predicted MFS family arabinose efflux permease